MDILIPMRRTVVSSGFEEVEEACAVPLAPVVALDLAAGDLAPQRVLH